MSRGTPKPCPFCEAQPVEANQHVNRDAFDIECRRCGRFTVSGTLYATQKVPPELRPDLSAYTRECQEKGEYPEMITTENLADFAERLRKIPPHEKPKRLLNILAKRSQYPGASAEFSPDWDYPLIYARNVEEAVYHRRALVDQGYIELNAEDRAVVTHKGWQHLERSTAELAPMPAAMKSPDAGKEWDVFICHASEDKESVVEPLVAALLNRGLRVWYDRTALTIGDSLRRSIDIGLSKSRYGIVVLSRAFFKKGWPQHELDGLLQKEIGGQKVILPVWHGVTHADVAQYSLPLADRVASSTAGGLEGLVNELVRAITATGSLHKPSESAAAVPAPPAKQVVAEEKWVDLDYPRDSGLQSQLEADGYKVKWCFDGKIARAVDIEGWELVYQNLGAGRRAILKLQDRPDNQTLIKKRHG